MMIILPTIIEEITVVRSQRCYDGIIKVYYLKGRMDFFTSHIWGKNGGKANSTNKH